MTAYVVLGQPKGGTSAVAGLLRLMGIYMGSKIGTNGHPFNHEDREMFKAPLNVVECIAAHRHLNHDKWGWKDPLLIKRWEKVEPLIPDAAPIVVLREPSRVAKSEVEWLNSNYDEAYLKAMKRYNKLLELSKNENYHVVCFDEMRQDPVPAILDLIEYTGVEDRVSLLDILEMTEFVSRRYRTLDGKEPSAPHI